MNDIATSLTPQPEPGDPFEHAALPREQLSMPWAMHMPTLERAADFVRGKWPDARPRIGLVLGSGWGPVAESFNIRESLSYTEIPGVGVSKGSDHAGRLLWAEKAGVETFVFQGRRHWYEGDGWTPVAATPFLSRTFGAEIMLFCNAAGTLNPEIKPGDIAVITDHINLTGFNPLSGEHHPFWGPRFPDMTDVYSPYLRAVIQNAGDLSPDLTLKEGVLGILGGGRAYETPAEVRALRAMGADLAGMSIGNGESMLSTSSGMLTAALSCASNWGAGMGRKKLDHKEVCEQLALSMSGIIQLLDNTWNLLADKPLGFWRS